MPTKLINQSLPQLALMILILGVLVRLFYFDRFGVMVFQHDWQGHVDMIKYIAEHWQLPAIPNKGWEYPQQPLYYLITALLYGSLESIGLRDPEILLGIGYFSLFCSVVFLLYGYRLLKLLTDSHWVQAVGVAFIALTPSLVYMSARINNDVLVMALSSVALFYTVRGYQHDFHKDFGIALVSVSLLFLTKVSSASIELLFFALLILTYMRVDRSNAQRLKKYLFIYGFVGIFLLSMTLWRVYLPLEGSFYMVNSAEFPKQTLEVLDMNYFASFNYTDLVSTAQSHVYGNDAVRHSFLTYQFGTMFFGEFDYPFFWERSPYLSMVMQSIYMFGMVFLFGFLGYLVHLYKENRLNLVLFGVVLINLILILKFVFSYPSICNTDFRYFVSSFLLIGFIFAQGLHYLNGYHRLIKYISSVLILGLVFSEVSFFYLLLTY